VVLGKYVPGMGFLPLLLGDEPVMDTPQLFYQRLIAMDEKEAPEIVQQYSKDHELIEVYDDLLLPALVSARRDYLADKLSTEHLDHIIAEVGQLISKTATDARGGPVAEYAEDAREVFGIPVEDTIDELAMSMLGNVLPKSVALKSISAEALSGEVIDQFQERQPAVACIGAVAPGGIHESRYLLKRLKTLETPVPVVLAQWGLKHEKKLHDLAKSAGLDAVATTLKEARNFVIERSKMVEASALKEMEIAAPEVEVAAEFQRN
jgi:hypothetical protein